MNFCCRSCGIETEVKSALDEAEYSFPELNAVFYICWKCLSGMHLRFEKDAVQLIEVIGAPGPHWDVIEELSYPGAEVRSDPGVLHVWLDGVHYEATAKGD